MLISRLLFALAALSLAACRPSVPAAVVSQLCVVRHAEAYKNLDPLPASLSDEELDSLTEHGEAQARAAAAELPEGIAWVGTSPLNRTQETATLLGLDPPVSIEPDLRPLEGGVPWDDRVALWAQGEDPRPDRGESLADGAARGEALLARLRGELEPGEHAVVVTHGDIASILLGELRGTPLLERPTTDTLSTGEVACVPLGGD